MKLSVATATLMATTVETSSSYFPSNRAFWKQARDHGWIPSSVTSSSSSSFSGPSRHLLSPRDHKTLHRGRQRLRRLAQKPDLLLRRKNGSSLTSPFQPSSSILVNKDRNKLHHPLLECDPQQNGIPDVGILSCGLKQYCEESSASSLGGVCADLEDASPQVQELEEVSSFPALKECDPDVGILSASVCGNHHMFYCQRTAESSLGGICMKKKERETGKSIVSSVVQQMVGNAHFHHPKLSSSRRQRRRGRRHLQEIGNTDNVGYSFDVLAADFCTDGNFTCSDCTYGETVSDKSFLCTYAEPICTGIPDYCAEDVYGVEDDGEDNVFDDDYSKNGTIPICANYVFGGTESLTSQTLSDCVQLLSPTQFEYCYARTISNNENSCEFSINGIGCNSCQVVVQASQNENDEEENDDDDVDDYCLIFDCENTDIPISGNSCTFSFETLLMREIQAAIFPCPNGCNICADEREVVGNPYRNITLPNAYDGASLYCQAAQAMAWMGYGPFTDPTYCQSALFEPCECYNPDDLLYPPPITEVPNATNTPIDDSPTAMPTDDRLGSSFLRFISNQLCSGNSYYECTTCEVNLDEHTANFNCTNPRACEDVPSFCAEPLNVCRQRLWAGSVRGLDIWDYEFCGTIESDRIFREEEPYSFEYCIEYRINPTGNACTMFVDGIPCTKCSLEYNNETDSFFASLDCRNTVWGATVDDFSNDNLLAETEEYMVYRNLPCPIGCNLCGSNDSLMTKQDATFTYKDSVQVCFQAQFAALTGPTSTKTCQDMQPSVREDCGCTDPPTLAPSNGSSLPPANVNSGGAISYALSSVSMAMLLFSSLVLLP